MNKFSKESGIILLFLTMLGSMACDSTKTGAKSSSDHAAISHAHTQGQDYFGAYELVDEDYGTQTIVSIRNGKRIMRTNSLPNHLTGNFPNKGNPNRISAQKKTYEFPLEPVYTGKAVWAREPGVALNGIKFEPQTAEMVLCESGEHFRIEAIQDLIDLGLDQNHAHVQPTGAYHYHGSPTGVIEAFDNGEDLVHIGFAHDGFPIYYSQNGVYKPSYQLIEDPRTGTSCTYSNPHTSMEVDIDGTSGDGTYGSDWEYIAGLGDLDECNGISVEGQYMYLVTDAFPYVGRCLMGEFTPQRLGPPPGAHPPHGRPPHGQGPPNGQRHDHRH